MNMKRIAALGALGVCAGIALAFALFVYLSRPTPSTAGFGLGSPQVAWISIGTIALGLIVVHLVFAHVLWHDDGTPKRP